MFVEMREMIFELFVAAICAFIWKYTDPTTLVSKLAYNTMFIASVTTLLFNANPLLRYDGYYILADYLEIPNLAQRSNEYLGYLVNRYVFGVDGGVSPLSASGERGWFVFYAVGSFIYRMFMMVSIAVL